MSMTSEIELKLRLSRADAVRLGRGGRFGALAGQRGTTRLMTSTYFDTPDLALRALGIGLRLRRIGQRRIQTMKLPIAGPVGAHSYRELESERAGDTPDLRSIADVDLPRGLTKRRIADDLRPVFTTDFKRTIWRIKGPDSDIEVALDLGQIKAGRRRLEFSELEFELKSGAPRALFDLALELLNDYPVSIEHRTKADRGHDLAAGHAPAPRRAQSPPLDDHMTARSAFSAIVRDCLDQLGGSEAAALLGRDPEGVHQMRIGLRRLRALFGAYRKHAPAEWLAPLSDDFDWLQRQLGAARDWDVFIAETLRPLATRLPEDPAIPAMLRVSAGRRAAGYRAMRATLGDRRYARLLLRLYRWLADPSWAASLAVGADPLDQPIGRFSKSVMTKRHRRLRKVGGKDAALPESELHRLRLQGKKLRYLAEFFRDLYPGKATKRFISALAEAQDHLGSLNDVVVSHDLLAEIGRRLSTLADASLAPHALGLVRGWQAARIDRDLGEFGKIWRNFRDLKPFWE